MIAAASRMAVPTLDRRERLLSAALGEYPHEVKDLPVGDVLCRYDDGTQWIAERKTARDLAQSIRTGLPLPSILYTYYTHTIQYIKHNIYIPSANHLLYNKLEDAGRNNRRGCTRATIASSS